MLVKVLDELGVPLVVGIGDGAGANILARLGLNHAERILGLVLINLVSAGVGFLESIKEKFFAKRRSSQQLCPEEIVAMHKVSHSGSGSPRGSVLASATESHANSPPVPTGYQHHPLTCPCPITPIALPAYSIPVSSTASTMESALSKRSQFGNSNDEVMKQLIENYSSNISKINPRNLRKYMTAYMNRREITDLANLDVLLIVGGKSPFASGVEHIYAKCNKQKTSILKIDNIVDVLK